MKSRKAPHPDGFMVEWRPTVLYITAASVLSAIIVATDVQNASDVKRELRETVTQSCAEAIESNTDTLTGKFLKEQESDRQFAEIFDRMEGKIDELLECSE